MNHAFLKKLPSPTWSYYISRNLSVWHDSLTIAYAKPGFALWGIQPYYSVRIHRGFHADFYSAQDGRYNRALFQRALFGRLYDPGYARTLPTRFRRLCERLLQTAHHTKPTAAGFERFFSVYGHAISMLDFTSFGSKIVTDHVLDILGNHPKRTDIIAYYGRPLKPSPIQMLDRDIKRLQPVPASQIMRTARLLHNKYCWIPVSFVGEAWSMDEIARRLKTRPASHRPPVKPSGVTLTKEQRYFLRLLGLLAELNEYRKGAFSQACYITRPVFDGLARKHGLRSWRELSLLPHDDILELARGTASFDPAKRVAQNHKPMAMYPITVSRVGFEHSIRAIQDFEIRFGEKLPSGASITGTTANPGRVTGTARIIHEPSQFHRLRRGDILIAKMTSVDFIPIMRKAAAFVTDEGGLASHAAIISREYGKPCIVGTKMATKFFHDGDTVKVDATKGVVKKL